MGRSLSPEIKKLFHVPTLLKYRCHATLYKCKILVRLKKKPENPNQTQIHCLKRSPAAGIHHPESKAHRHPPPPPPSH